jgi:hypothetical protein
MRRQIIAVVIILLVALTVGCSAKLTKSPEALTQGYVNLMKAGKYDAAAALWDYDAQGRAGNSDWDTFGASQRKLIIKESKWAEEKARALEQWATYFADVKVESVQTSGETAHAVLEGRVTGLDMVKVKEQWLISAMN